jgi:large subunit ribosomal protein L3
LKGILGRKKGMTRVFSEDGRVEPVSVIEAGPCVVTQVKTRVMFGYQAVQLGYEETKRLNKPEAGHLKSVTPLRHLKEFRVDDLGDAQVGQKIDVAMFQPGDLVNVIGTSKGRGFAGGVKRHHFRGGPKTHGQSDRHRAPGSIGAGTTPGKVWKGTPMAGHMGNVRVTVPNLRVVMVDPERNLLLVRGAVPGARNGMLIVQKSRKGVV